MLEDTLYLGTSVLLPHSSKIKMAASVKMGMHQDAIAKKEKKKKMQALSLTVQVSIPTAQHWNDIF